MATEQKRKGGVFLRKKKSETLGEKALAEEGDWKGDGTNKEQTAKQPVLKTIGDGGTQPGHPAKHSQPKTMRFLNRA